MSMVQSHVLVHSVELNHNSCGKNAVALIHMRDRYSDNKIMQNLPSLFNITYAPKPDIFLSSRMTSSTSFPVAAYTHTASRSVKHRGKQKQHRHEISHTAIMRFYDL